MTALRVAPATRLAALYAAQHWHYSRKLPAGKLFIRGVWEDDRFVGVITFSRGASARLGSPWGLTQTQIAELSRIALDTHEHPVTEMLSRAIRDLKAANPGLRALVSYADPEHGHHGGVYQAANWVYTGERDVGPGEFIVHGVRLHARSVHAKRWRQSLAWLREHVDPNATQVFPPEKHRYMFPLDRAMRRLVLASAQPYPGPAAEVSTRDARQPSGGPGSIPGGRSTPP